MPQPAPSRSAAPLPSATVALAVLLLTGCAAVPELPLPDHPPPAPGQPWARVSMRAAVPANDRFSLRVLADEAQCQQPQLLTQGSPRQPAPAARLRAGQRVTLEFVVHRTGQSACSVRWSFVPRADRLYLVQGMTVADGCPAQLFDTTQPERPQAPPDLLLRSTSTQACVPLGQAQAARSQAVSPIRGGQVNGEAVLNPRATTDDLRGLITP
ncbi:hypothetical protein AACH10_15950 [Ideonella sp. DXS22W]|uniref:Ig-like domain-containing protein n=1 Tax=Pseudaquabacterium inlustre TaxID=2984192 RepID=A0ABU9CIS5_9BURK